MKTNNLLIVVILFSVIMLFSNKALANSKGDSTALTINGIIVTSNKKVNTSAKCKVLLYKGNVLIDSVLVKYHSSYEFKLIKNNWYTIKVIGQNMVPLMVSFDTNVGEENAKYKKFYFETELYSVSEYKFMNQDIVEFPIGHVQFNSQSGYFEANERYTAFHYDALFIEKKEIDHVAKNDLGNGE